MENPGEQIDTQLKVIDVEIRKLIGLVSENRPWVCLKATSRIINDVAFLRDYERNKSILNNSQKEN